MDLLWKRGYETELKNERNKVKMRFRIAAEEATQKPYDGKRINAAVNSEEEIYKRPYDI